MTRLLAAWTAGDDEALAQLMARVYPELRRLAAHQLRRERADHTLQTAGLVHESFLRLIDQRRVTWQGRGHFFAIAARMMRRILVDHARRLRYAKRGGGSRRVSLGVAAETHDRTVPLPELDEALDLLADQAPDQARVVELRFFGGLSNEQIAEVLGISTPTVVRRWRVARAWLYRQLKAS